MRQNLENKDFTHVQPDLTMSDFDAASFNHHWAYQPKFNVSTGADLPQRGPIAVALSLFTQLATSLTEKS
jgi:hypothetical protein